MTRHRASVLVPSDVRRLCDHVERQRYPERNKVLILLSFKAGLRACEIAGLEWPMVLASDGKISPQLSVSRCIAKGGSFRAIPMHKELRRALRKLNAVQGGCRTGHVIRSERAPSMTAGSVVNWFKTLYDALGLVGCSSHSGRRTFITMSARALIQTGGSLRDVQELAGHRALTTTERYIQGDRAAQRRLIDLI